MKQPRVIDVCCGAGGFSEGFRQAGFDIVLGVDNWGTAIKTFKYNQHCEVLKADIRTLEPGQLPDCDIMIGAPPCHEFSIAKQVTSRTFDLSIVKAFLKLVRLYKPSFWVMENSPELIKHIKKHHQIIKACGYGLRQRRRRAFFGTLPEDLTTECNGHRHVPAVAATEWKGCSSRKNMHKMNRFSDYLGRRATVQECRQEMGYPDRYEFFGIKEEQYVQIGNSVCPPVAKAIAESIMRNVWT